MAGAAFCMMLYASEVVMAQAVPYGMTGIMLPTGAFVSGETIMTAAMTTGYTVTGSNMLVKVNDSVAGLTGNNVMAGAMGQANYQLVKETSAQASNKVMEFGLSNPRLYGTNNNVGNIKENATYDNSVKKVKTEILNENKARGAAFEQQKYAEFSAENKHAVQQITIKTPSGTRTRVDAIGIDADGNIVIQEYKSSATAPLTQNQKNAFKEIEASGGIVVGAGKDIFTGGYQIPVGTKIKVIRPDYVSRRNILCR